MKYESVIASTDIDSHGERMDREGIERIVATIARAYVPFGIEHDPRIPPRGRISSGYIRERPDGEYEAVATIELFDEDSLPGDDERELVTKSHTPDGLTVSYDRSYRFDVDLADIAEIAKVFRNEAEQDLKKSTDPISLITIAGKFAAVAIAAGFFGQIGADGWNLVKKKLADLYRRKENRHGEQLLMFRALIVDGKDVEIEIILTNPTTDNIDRLLGRDLQAIERFTSAYLLRFPDIRRLVFEVKSDHVEIKFAILKDCRPVRPSLEDD